MGRPSPQILGDRPPVCPKSPAVALPKNWFVNFEPSSTALSPGITIPLTLTGQGSA